MPPEESGLQSSLESKAEKMFKEVVAAEGNPKVALPVKVSVNIKDSVRINPDSLRPIKTVANKFLTECIEKTKNNFKERYGFDCEFLILEAKISNSLKAKIVANVDLTKKEQRKVLKSRYGIEPNGWLGFADEPNEKNIVQLIERVADKFPDLSPSIIYTIAIGEGLNLYIQDNKTPSKVDVNRLVDSFEYLGLDFAAKELKEKRIKKLLPIDFKEGKDFFPDTPYIRMEPPGDPKKWITVYPAIFNNLESALTGFAAILNSRMNLFLEDVAKLGYSEPGEDERLYWTYFYFQNIALGKSSLKKNGSTIFYKNKTPISKLSEERVVTWRFVKINRLFKN